MFDSRRGQYICLFQPGYARIEMTARGRGSKSSPLPISRTPPGPSSWLGYFDSVSAIPTWLRQDWDDAQGARLASSSLPISQTPPGPSSCLGYFDSVFGYFHLAKAKMEMTARGARPVSSIITTSQTPPGPLSWLLGLIESLPIRTWQKPGLSWRPKQAASS